MLIRKRTLVSFSLALIALLAGGIFYLLENSTFHGQVEIPQPQHFFAELRDGEVKLRWDPVDGAVSYNIYRREIESGQEMWIATTIHTMFTDSAAESGKNYLYKVAALGSKGESLPSETAISQSNIE